MSIQNRWEQKFIWLEHCISALSLKKNANKAQIGFKDHFYRNVFVRKMDELNTCMRDMYPSRLQIKFIAAFT